MVYIIAMIGLLLFISFLFALKIGINLKEHQATIVMALNGFFLVAILLTFLISACMKQRWPIDYSLVRGREDGIRKLAEARNFYDIREKQKSTKSNFNRKLPRHLRHEPLPAEIQEFKNKQLFIMAERLETLSDLDGIQHHDEKPPPDLFNKDYKPESTFTAHKIQQMARYSTRLIDSMKSPTSKADTPNWETAAVPKSSLR